MKSLETKIPPPAVALGLALLMWATSRLAEPIQVSLAIRLSLALSLVVIGQCISVGGMVSFRRAKTTINPFNPTAASSLVTSGVYRFTRNPMYVGLLLTLFAWAVFLSSLPSVAFLPLFVLYINQFQIKPEERVLSSLFGSEYVAYQKRVRRWI
jgi:protein-S-isoprenylcysteine O-methyltransferase Ste14